MVKTIKQTIVNEEKIRMSLEEAKELALLNVPEVDIDAPSDEEVKLPHFTRFGTDEFGIDDIQSE